MSFSLEHILFLQALPGVGPATFWQLIERYSDFHALAADDCLLEKLSGAACQAIESYRTKGDHASAFVQIERDIEAVNQCGAHIIPYNHPSFPELLRQIPSCPPVLYIKGHVDCLSMPQIAVVGSRNSSSAGHRNAEIFSKELAEKGFAITSGLALGVDSAAHVGALKGAGVTIAVVGTGIDRLYPKQNMTLANDILNSGGAIVSEFPLGTKPAPQNFPRRNRTISGLSLGTLVVEAALRSGSLITARFAMEQNREIFAIPGSIHSPLSRGCHSLIKQGATLVETSTDIVEQLDGLLAFQWGQLTPVDKNGLSETGPNVQEVQLCELEKKVLSLVGYDPIGADQVTELSGLSISEVNTQLMNLELKSMISMEATGYVRST